MSKSLTVKTREVLPDTAALAARINAEHRLAVQAVQSAVRHGRKAGLLLIEVRERLPYGDFGKWLKANIRCSKSTAYTYMGLAALTEEEFQRVGNLSLRRAQREMKRIAHPDSDDAARAHRKERKAVRRSHLKRRDLRPHADDMVTDFEQRLDEQRRTHADGDRKAALRHIIDIAERELWNPIDGLPPPPPEMLKGETYPRVVTFDAVAELVSTFHYADNEPTGIHRTFGLYARPDAPDFDPIAAAVFREPIGKGYPKGTLELTRLVRHDDHHGLLSEFVSWSVRWLKQNTDAPFVLSYADMTQAHHGGIYQACNFVYVEECKPLVTGWRKENG